MCVCVVSLARLGGGGLHQQWWRRHGRSDAYVRGVAGAGAPVLLDLSAQRAGS